MSKENSTNSSTAIKLVLTGILALVIEIAAAIAFFSSKGSLVPVFFTAINDESEKEFVLSLLDSENVRYTAAPEGIIFVDDESTAERIRNEIRTCPDALDSGSVENKNLAIEKSVKKQIEALNGVASADVKIGFPDDSLFTENQKPVTASVILTFKPGCEILPGSRKVKTIQKLLLHSVVGLKDEYITISSVDGVELNNFSDQQSLDRLSLAEREQKLRSKHETEVREKVLRAIRSVFPIEQQVRDISVTCEYDMSSDGDKTIYAPIEITPQNPDEPYGPCDGIGTQNPPVYSDMTNSIIISNTVESREGKSGRITVSANIDGSWKPKFDGKGNYAVTDGFMDFEYTPVSAEQLEQAKKFVESAIDFDKLRGDTVVLTNEKVDHSAEFSAIEKAWLSNMKNSRVRKISFIILVLDIIVFAAVFTKFKF